MNRPILNLSLAVNYAIGKLDPRGYEVHPIGPPDASELAHHHLWRFWTRTPAAGGSMSRNSSGWAPIKRAATPKSTPRSNCIRNSKIFSHKRKMNARR